MSDVQPLISVRDAEDRSIIALALIGYTADMAIQAIDGGISMGTVIDIFGRVVPLLNSVRSQAFDEMVNLASGDIPDTFAEFIRGMQKPTGD